MSDPAEFDRFADNYDECLNDALAASGETKEFFRGPEWSGLRSVWRNLVFARVRCSTMAAARATRQRSCGNVLGASRWSD